MAVTELQISDVVAPGVRPRVLASMASLCVAAGEMRAAEGYLLELLAWIAFGDKAEDSSAAA